MPPRRSACRRVKESTTESKKQQEEAQSSLASELADLSSSSSPPVKDDSEPSRIDTEGELFFQEEQGIVLEESVKEDEKNGDIAIEDYLNLSWDGNAVVWENSSNLNGEEVIEKEENSDATVVEEGDDSNLNSEEDDLAKGGVAGEERGVEAGGENAGDYGGDQNVIIGTRCINQDANTNLVEEESPAAHCEEAIVLGDGDDVHDVKKDGDMEGEGEKSENSVDDDECNENNKEDQYIVLEDGDDIYDVQRGGDMEGEDEKSENSEDDDEEYNEDNGEDENIVLGDGDAQRDGVKEGEGKKDEDSEDEDEDNGEDEHISEFINHHLTYRKTEKILEIHVGGLDKAAVEDDLIKIFSKFGEIQDVRIARNSTTKKSKGFGFIRYVTVEQAKNALSELKDGIEMRGKQVRISASQNNDTLYVGNICRRWRKEKVLETLKGFGIQQVHEIYLPDDPEKDGKIKGYAFLEFSTHTDAMAAFQRLRKPDAIFGRAISAKVAFTPPPSEEVLSQIRTVYVEGLPASWDEAKVKEICKQYGEIERVKLSRNLKRKRKDFGFITFTFRESALACMVGINSSQSGEGEVEVKANMAKANSKGRLQMVTRGGFKVEKNSKRTEQTGSVKMEDHTKSKGDEREIDTVEKAGSSKMKGHAKSRRAEKKGKELAKEKGKAFLNSESGKEGKSDKHQSSVSKGQGIGLSSKPERRDRKRKNLPSKLDGRGRRDIDCGYSKRPSKKVRGDMRGKQGNALRNPRSNSHVREGHIYPANSVAHRNPYSSRYDASATSYSGHVYGASSGSKRHHSDMEPHAGFLRPAVGVKQGRPHARHIEPAHRTQGQPHARYAEPAVRKGHPHAGHAEAHLVRQVRHHAGYIEPALGTQSQPHAGYIAPAVGNQTHNPYDYESRRVGIYDGQGSRGSAYAGGSALPPSYDPNYTSYAGYEQGAANVGNYYQSSRSALQPRRAYY